MFWRFLLHSSVEMTFYYCRRFLGQVPSKSRNPKPLPQLFRHLDVRRGLQLFWRFLLRSSVEMTFYYCRRFLGQVPRNDETPNRNLNFFVTSTLGEVSNCIGDFSIVPQSKATLYKKSSLNIKITLNSY